MTRIVSVAPTTVEADSRTLKIAISFARYGYESVLVEAGKSHLPGLHGVVRLISMGALPRPSAEAAPARAAGGRPAATEQVPLRCRGGSSLRWVLGRALPEVLKRPLRSLLRAGHAVWMETYRCLLLPLWHVPRGSLYYLHAPYQFPGVFVRARIHRAPIVYDAHDFYPGIDAGREQLPPVRRAVARFHDRLEALCVRRAAAVVTVSNGVAELIEKTYGRTATVVRNCHDARLDQPIDVGIRERLGLTEDAFIVVAVGQAKPGAAIEEAVAALSSLPRHVHIAFLGRGYNSRLGNEVEKQELIGRVHLIGPVKPHEVVPFMRSASVALLLYYPLTANYANCLPNGFFQSVAAGLPLLYPELREIKALAEQYRLGIQIDPRDPTSIAAGISRVLGDKVEHEAFRCHARSAAEALSWECEEQRLFDVIESVLRGAGTDRNPQSER